MSANPTNAKMMMVNCIVNQSYNPVTPPNMNTPVMLVKICSICHSLQWDQPAATSIICSVCKATTRVLDHGPKRAVICGITYQNSSHKLKSSIDDARRMKDLLMNLFRFEESDIVMLTEEETHPLKTPTKENLLKAKTPIKENLLKAKTPTKENLLKAKTPTKENLLKALYWLGQDYQPGGSLVFHYSGHGLRLRDYRQGGVDGYDETLCPMDFEKKGMIFDDEINAVIVSHLPRGVKLHAIIDSRHRKSVLGLPYLYRKKRSGQYEWENQSPRSDVFKRTSGGNAISFSGSVDVLTSADTQLLSNTTPPGLMTSCFIQAIEDGLKQQKLTYRSILDSMHDTMNRIGGNLRQEPLLSACGDIDVDEDFTL